MRGRTDINRSLGRRRRRCLLAGLLSVSGTAAWADAPVAIAPLPLVVPFEQDGQCVQINPFCRPVTTSSDQATVHAAGTIQLTPLDELPENQVMLSSGQQFETPLLSTADGGVQFRIEAFSQSAETDATHELLTDAAPRVYPVPVPLLELPMEQAAVVISDQAGPADEVITFSFSDSSPAASEPAIVRPMRAAHPTVAAAPVDPASLSEPQPQPRPRAVWRVGNDQVVHVDPPSLSDSDSEVQLSSPTLARPAAGNKTLLVPIEEPSGAVVTAVGSGRLPDPKRPTEESRLVNGARPKVDVGRPPLIVQRGQSRVLTVEPERPAAPLPVVAQPEQQLPARPEPVAKANLRFQPTEVRALKAENAIQRVEIQSAAVCAAVQTGSHQVQLIATGVGKTQLTLWTLDATGKEQGELYEIQVADAKSAKADDVHSIATTLTQSIAAAFPTSRVAVQPHGGRLLISGVCPDEDSARRILRMARSACPMPVDDKITVR